MVEVGAGKTDGAAPGLLSARGWCGVPDLVWKSACPSCQTGQPPLWPSRSEWIPAPLLQRPVFPTAGPEPSAERKPFSGLDAPVTCVPFALPDLPPSGQSPAAPSTRGKSHLSCSSGRPGGSFAKGALTEVPIERAADFGSASFPSLPVAHHWWHFLKENKGVAAANERLRRRRRRLPVLSLARALLLRAQHLSARNGSSRPLLRGAGALRALGGGGVLLECSWTEVLSALGSFREDSEAKPS